MGVLLRGADTLELGHECGETDLEAYTRVAALDVKEQAVYPPKQGCCSGLHLW